MKKQLKNPGILILIGLVLLSFSSWSAAELSSRHNKDLIDAARSWNLYEIKKHVDSGLDLQSHPQIFHGAASAMRLSRGEDVENLIIYPVNEWVNSDGIRYPISADDPINPDSIAAKPITKAAIQVFQFFLNNGVDVNALDGGVTPLHTALLSDVLLTGSRIHIRAMEEFDFIAADLIAALIYLGADIHRVDSRDRTPFHFAIEHGQIREAEILSLHGANPNTTDNWGNNGLHSLFLNTKLSDEWVVRTARAFVDLGGDICMRNKRGHAPFTLAFAGDLSYETKDRLMEIFLSTEPSCRLQ